jgi:hypothetical protein
MKDNKYERGNRAESGGARKGRGRRRGHGRGHAGYARNSAPMTEEALERYYLNKYDR